ncbi:MAG: hypothetical protein J6W75_07050 [Bacteroidaceae bacterium]|nr:hypothetical protein [Bacteroidaceae bacterium]
MCTYHITVDEQKLSKMSPAYSREEFGRILQCYVDEFVDAITGDKDLSDFSVCPTIPVFSYDDTLDLEDARLALHEMVDYEYSK